MFIRGPFILQGLLYGVVAGVITLFIFYPLTFWIGGATEAFFELNLFEYYMHNFPKIFLIIIGSGVCLGTISSGLAIARYLKT